MPAGAQSLTLNSTFTSDNSGTYYLIAPASSPTIIGGPTSSVDFTALHPTSPSPITVPGPVAGDYTLRVDVTNDPGGGGNPVGLLVVGSVTCSMPTCVGGRDISTGVGSTAASGIADSRWTVTSAPGGVPIPNAYPVVKYVNWVVPPAGTNWIDPNNTGADLSDPAGTYRYETTFSVPPGIKSLWLNSTFTSDNSGTYYLIAPASSPTIIGGPTSGVDFTVLHPTSPSPITVPGPVAGDYTLRVDVTNDPGGVSGNPVGLLVVGTVTCPAVSVGGVAEQPGVADLPSRASTASRDHSTAFALGGSAAVVFAVVALGGWVMASRRRLT